jgi:hypothetical protein
MATPFKADSASEDLPLIRQPNSFYWNALFHFSANSLFTAAELQDFIDRGVKVEQVRA